MKCIQLTINGYLDFFHSSQGSISDVGYFSYKNEVNDSILPKS